MASRLTIQERKEIFLALVTLQDTRVSVSDSKQKVMADYNLTPKLLEQIVEEGTDKEWPPFDGVVSGRV